MYVYRHHEAGYFISNHELTHEELANHGNKVTDILIGYAQTDKEADTIISKDIESQKNTH